MMFPNIGESYQVKVIPMIGVIALFASRVCIGDHSHSVIFPVDIGAVGAGLIVKVTAVLEYEEHIPSFDST